MKKYLEAKYGEEFVIERVREAGVFDGGSTTAGGTAYAVSKPDQPFTVIESPEADGGYTDDRVVAAWGGQLKDASVPLVADVLGEGVGVGVTLSVTNGHELSPDLIGAPVIESLRSLPQPAVADLLVIIPVTESARPEDYSESLANLYNRFKGLGLGQPVLNVWFVSSPAEAYSDDLRYLSEPNTSISGHSVDEGVLAETGIDWFTDPVNAAEIAARIVRR